MYNEHLASVSNLFLEKMTKHVHKYGGDIISFLGNSMIIVWPRGCYPKEDKDEDNDLIIARKAT